jgi:hypothetical protein
MLRMNDRGVSKLSVVFWVLVVASAVHLGVAFLPMYLDVWGMEDVLKGKAGTARNYSDEQILYDLINEAKQRNLPMNK